jgi:hypothetical protein
MKKKGIHRKKRTSRKGTRKGTRKGSRRRYSRRRFGYNDDDDDDDDDDDMKIVKSQLKKPYEDAIKYIRKNFPSLEDKYKNIKMLPKI